MRRRETLTLLFFIWMLGGYSAMMAFEEGAAWMGWTMVALVIVNILIASTYFRGPRKSSKPLPGKVTLLEVLGTGDRD